VQNTKCKVSVKIYSHTKELR